MGNIFTNDVVTNAINGNTQIKNGSSVVRVDSATGEIAATDGKLSEDFSGLEDRLTDKFDEIDYYDIPEALDGGGFTPTPTPTATITPTPTPTPSPTPV